jgi:uncharacterized protein YegL
MTEIICILDRSGSMEPMKNEVINSYNHFINKQKELPITTVNDKLTLVLFDDNYELVHNRIPLINAPALTSSVYYIRGMTALNDAIGKTINSVSPLSTNVVVLIQTDGSENSSKEYNSERIRTLIKEKEKMGWEFNFVGAGLDAFNQGSTLGLNNKFYAMTTNSGIQQSFGYLTQQCSNYRNNQSTTKTTTTTTTYPTKTSHHYPGFSSLTGSASFSRGYGS